LTNAGPKSASQRVPVGRRRGACRVQVLFRRPPARTGRASFPASRLSSDLFHRRGSWWPGVDYVVAGSADHEGLASPFRHQLSPRWLWSSRLDEVDESADVVHVHLGLLLAELTAASPDPDDKLLALGAGRAGDSEAVDENSCRYSRSNGRPRLPRSRRTSNTVSASCITHTSRLRISSHLAPFAHVDGFPALPGGALLPRLLRGLRHH
jgi:hypothetical protein